MTSLPAPDRSTITGVILAGGLGRRMAAPGQTIDKGLAAFRGRPMVASVIDRLAGQLDELVVNANRNHDDYAAFGLRVVGDEVAGFAGPLAGLHAAAGVARRPWLLTVPCDSPFLPDDLAERMASAVAAARVPLGVARAGGREQPVFLLAHASLRDDIGRFLAAGEAKVDRWYAPIDRVVVDFDDVDAFRNLNTADELSRHSDA